MAPLPRRDEVATVRARADHAGVLGILRPLRQELRAAAAERDVDAVADLELDELARDVRKARRARVGGEHRVVLPVAVRGVCA